MFLTEDLYEKKDYRRKNKKCYCNAQSGYEQPVTEEQIF